MIKILKRSLFSACLCEGLSFLLIVTGTRAHDDVITSTWYCKLGLVFHWPGMMIEDVVGGTIINNWVPIVGVPLVLWFLVWLPIWFLVEKIKTKGNTPNQQLNRIENSAEFSNG